LLIPRGYIYNDLELDKESKAQKQQKESSACLQLFFHLGAKLLTLHENTLPLS